MTAELLLAFPEVPEDPDIAIALKYDTQKDGAPRVIAKGMRLKAEKIREIAKASTACRS